jgi:hypothetical protein
LRVQWKVAYTIESGKEDGLLSYDNMGCHFPHFHCGKLGTLGSPSFPTRSWRTPLTLSPSFLEGRTASGAGSMSASLAVKGPGPIDGGSTFYPDNAGLYPNQAEQGMELELEYDEHSLDELERRFLEETIELTKDQNKEEDKENARHRKILREIQEQYQQKMTQLRAKQAKQREDFLRHEAHMRYQQPPSTGYGHYPYARSVPPYDDSLPPYDMTYEQPIPTDTTHGHPLVYESYSDAGGASYNRKQGYDGSKVHSKNQVYETSSHPYGGSPPYPAYG